MIPIPNFKTGDVVSCNEHPHAMTVRTVTRKGVTCDWFVGETPFQALYPLDSLRAVTESLPLADVEPVLSDYPQ